MKTVELTFFGTILGLVAFAFICLLYSALENTGLHLWLNWEWVSILVFSWAYLSWPFFELVRRRKSIPFWWYVVTLPAALATIVWELLTTEELH